MSRGREEARSRFLDNAHVQEPAQITQLLKEADDAADFMLNSLAQGVLQDGKYGVFSN